MIVRSLANPVETNVQSIISKTHPTAWRHNVSRPTLLSEVFCSFYFAHAHVLFMDVVVVDVDRPEGKKKTEGLHQKGAKLLDRAAFDEFFYGGSCPFAFCEHPLVVSQTLCGPQQMVSGNGDRGIAAEALLCFEQFVWETTQDFLKHSMATVLV